MLFLTLITYFYGINVLNLNIENTISYLFVGVIGVFGLSLIPSRKNYIIGSVLGFMVLVLSMYVFEPFYITDISIIPLIYLLVYFFIFFVRYSNLKSYISNILLSIVYSIFLVAFIGSVNIFFIYLFNLDVSFVNLIMFVGFVIYTYYNAEVHFKVYDEFKYVSYIMNGKNIVKKVEYDYED